MKILLNEFTLPMFIAVSWFGTAIADDTEFQPTPTRRQLSKKIEDLIELQMHGLVPALEAQEIQIQQLVSQVEKLKSQLHVMEGTTKTNRAALARAEASVEDWRKKLAMQQAELDLLRIRMERAASDTTSHVARRSSSSSVGSKLRPISPPRSDDVADLRQRVADLELRESIVNRNSHNRSGTHAAPPPAGRSAIYRASRLRASSNGPAAYLVH